jgi:hypothetical protein
MARSSTTSSLEHRYVPVDAAKKFHQSWKTTGLDLDPWPLGDVVRRRIAFMNPAGSAIILLNRRDVFSRSEDRL